MKKNLLVGRTEERKILEEALTSHKAEMISLVGRRRVGKTYLVNTVYSGIIDFEITGIQYATRSEQLQNFMIQLSNYFKTPFPTTAPNNWLEAFHYLTQFLEKKQVNRKLVVFLDELPWLSTHRSGFLKGFSFFWNSWAVKQNIVVVICGSAASWMIKKVVHHRGGLHNRITKRITLKPFTLAETKAFLTAKGIQFDHYQIIHLYMAMGGIPHYLDEVKKGWSYIQNINKICFTKNGLLYDEFPKLYSSLFEDSAVHYNIIRVLAQKRIGLTRSEIVLQTGLSEGGRISNALEELEHSGFINMYYPFGKKKKDSLYRLTDEYSLFYLRFIEPNLQEEQSIWQELSQTPVYTSWSGYAFESICLKHVPQIKKALGISGVYAKTSSFIKKGNEEARGLQIDLLIDRKDHVINLCEMKFYNDQLNISKEMGRDFRRKKTYFKELTKTKKQVFLTLISTFGVVPTNYNLSMVDVNLTMDILFEE